MQPNPKLDLTTLFWSTPAVWPKGNSRNVFLAASLDEVGRAIVEGWAGDEPLRYAQADLLQLQRASQPRDLLADWKHETLTVPLTLSSSSSSWAITAEKNKQAEKVAATPDWHVRTYREAKRLAAAQDMLASALAVQSRLDAAMDWIRQHGCETNHLITRGRIAGVASDYVELPPFVWNIEHLWQSRFASCKVTLQSISYHVFLDRASLDRCLAKASAPVVGLVKAERDAERWLSEQFAAPCTSTKSKSAFEQEALRLFKGLSKNGFGRAWSRATLEHPERKMAGAKRKLDR